MQVLAQGPGVMTGYFRDEGATAKAFRAGHGWLDTGDLGWQAPGECSPVQDDRPVLRGWHAADLICHSATLLAGNLGWQAPDRRLP